MKHITVYYLLLLPVNPLLIYNQHQRLQKCEGRIHHLLGSGSGVCGQEGVTIILESVSVIKKDSRETPVKKS